MPFDTNITSILWRQASDSPRRLPLCWRYDANERVIVCASRADFSAQSNTWSGYFIPSYLVDTAFGDLAHKLENCNWVFPATTGDGSFVGAPRIFQRLCISAKLADVSLHTLRHTFASVAADLGYSELTIAGLLGHRGSSVTARYAHVPDRALISAADHVAGEISRVLSGQVMDGLRKAGLALAPEPGSEKAMVERFVETVTVTERALLVHISGALSQDQTELTNPCAVDRPE